jgi:hypothetical protein
MVRVFTYNGIRGIIALACAIIFATLFNGQGQAVGDYIGVLNVAGAMYSGTIFIGVIFCFQTQDPVSLRRWVGVYGCFVWAALTRAPPGVCGGGQGRGPGRAQAFAVPA